MKRYKVTNWTLLVSGLAAALLIHGYQIDSWGWGVTGVVVLLFTPVGKKGHA